jgi:hypothetical protein
MRAPCCATNQHDAPKVRQQFHQLQQILRAKVNFISLDVSDLSPSLVSDVPGNDVPNDDFVAADLRDLQLFPKVPRCLVWILK